MTEPVLPQPQDLPPGAGADPIAWRWVAITAVIALIGLVTTIIVVQHRHSGASTPTATKTTKPTTNLQVLSAAAAKTAALNASHMNLTMTVGGHGQQFSFRFGGDVSRHPALGRLTGTLPGGLGRLDERLIGRTLYMSVGNHALAGGRHWIGMHVAGLGSAFGGGSDPVSMLKTIADARGVRELGSATVNGVATTEYRARVDLASIVARLPSQFRFGDTSSIHGTATMDVFVAGDGTARKIEEHMGFGGLAVTIVATVRPISHVAAVVAPPASDVLRVHNLADALRAFGAPA